MAFILLTLHISQTIGSPESALCCIFTQPTSTELLGSSGNAAASTQVSSVASRPSVLAEAPCLKWPNPAGTSVVTTTVVLGVQNEAQTELKNKR